MLAPASSQAKIGVIIHDHGAPGIYDKTADPFLSHDDNSYYGIKLFLRHLVMMKVIPNIVFCGDMGNDTTQCDGNTFYAPEDYYKGFSKAEYECVGGSVAGLTCFNNGNCTGGTCETALNLIDSTSTAIGMGGSASLTDTSQIFSSYKDGTYVVLSGFGAGAWWGFIGSGGASDTINVYNNTSRTTQGWCYLDPSSVIKKYWIRKDPTPFMDAWGDPPADYASLLFNRNNDSTHYDEHFRLLNAGPGYTNPPAGPDKNFDEYGGLSFYYSWQGMGGYEPYFFQNYPQMSSIRDTIWTNYQGLLKGVGSDSMEDLIRLTQGIDYQFSDDPTKGQCVDGVGMPTGTACFDNGDCSGGDTCDLDKMPGHGQSLYDAVIDLVDNIQVDKIIIAEHFVGHSRMMNEDMGRITVKHALEDALDSTPPPVIYAPDRILIGEVDYPRVDADYFADDVVVGGHYTFSQPWKGPTYVAGTFFNTTLSDCIVEKAVTEIQALITGGADNIAVFLSGHGTSGTTSGAYDSLNDTPHFNTKVWFINSVRAIVSDLGGDKTSVVFGPDAVLDSEVNYAGWYKVSRDGSGNSGMDIISRTIKDATVTISGKKYKFYRSYGQNGYTEQGTSASANCEREDPALSDHPCGPDPHDLVYTPREALQDLVALNSAVGGCGKKYTDALDLLVAFFGDSADLLYDHREEGYGEGFGYCNGNDPGADATRCADQKALYDLANQFPNPGVQDTSDIHHVSNYTGDPNDCALGTGTPSYDPADWVAGNGVYNEVHQFTKDCYRSNFTYDCNGLCSADSIDVHITNATYCFDKKEQAVEENISAALDDAAGDNDGIPAAEDNCPSDYNPNQEDGDCDGLGDACDGSTNCGSACDDDCDGVPNVAGGCGDDDNCRYVWNPSQADNDGDGIGNACDTIAVDGAGTDSDGDGYGDPWAYENGCSSMLMGMMMPMAGRDPCDNCPDTYNPNQKDSDLDGQGDCCDAVPHCGGGDPACDTVCTAP